MEMIMPVNLSIKEVPDTLADRLRARAERHHRSLQRELMAIIEMAVKDDIEAAAPKKMHLPAGASDGRKSIEEIAAAHRARFPHPITTGPLAVDIIRRDRDSR
jgi:plasmid stability protein